MLGWSVDQLLDSTLKQFFCALKGKYEYDSEQLEAHQKLIYKGFQYNSANIAAGLSKELAKEISKQKFSWEEKTKKEKSGFNYSDLLSMSNKVK